MQHVLYDLLVPRLHVVFVGTAVGATSAIKRAYYAGPGNKFWPTLAEVGFTPYQLKPVEFRDLPNWGIGLTDVAKFTSGRDRSLSATDFNAPDLMARIKAVQPRIVAFNGKAAAQIFLGRKQTAVNYGLGPKLAGFPAIYVLPSTSGAASGYWSLDPWQKLADLVRKHGAQQAALSA